MLARRVQVFAGPPLTYVPSPGGTPGRTSGGCSLPNPFPIMPQAIPMASPCAPPPPRPCPTWYNPDGIRPITHVARPRLPIGPGRPESTGCSIFGGNVESTYGEVVARPITGYREVPRPVPASSCSLNGFGSPDGLGGNDGSTATGNGIFGGGGCCG